MAWLDAPLFGHGFGSFEWGYLRHRSDHLEFMPTTVLVNPSISPGTAHNELIQMLVELGLVGAVMAGVFAFVCWKRLHGLPQYAVYVVGLLCFIEFPLMNPSTAIVGTVALALATRD